MTHQQYVLHTAINTHTHIYSMKQFISMAFEFATALHFPCVSPSKPEEKNAPWKVLDKAL